MGQVRLSWKVAFCLVLLVALCSGDFIPSFLWDPKNIRFNTVACKDGNTIEVKPGDVLNLVCPTSFMNNQVLSNMVDKTQLYFNIYMTTNQKVLESCDASQARFIYNCRPNVDRFRIRETVDFAIINFRPQTNPNGILFQEGVTYHFFSTSNGSEASLKNAGGGFCLTHNMRLSVYYCWQHEACPSRSRISMCASGPVSQKVLTAASTNAKFADPYVILVLVLGIVVGCSIGVVLGVVIKSRKGPITSVMPGNQCQSLEYDQQPSEQDSTDSSEAHKPLNGHCHNEQKFIV